MTLKLKIVHGRPPIYDEILRAIGRPPAGAIFTWGDKLYVPNPPAGMMQPLSEHLLEHEETHSRQQAIIGGPEPWWRIYLESPDFRLQQEIAAYRNQYAFACRGSLGRQGRRHLARQLARDLSGPMYGHIVKRDAALDAITIVSRRVL